MNRIKTIGLRSALADYGLPLAALSIMVGVGIIIHLDQKHVLPSPDALKTMDAGWYKMITDGGYDYKSDGANNTAFFPLFPYLWRLLGSGLISMAVINGLLFVGASGALLRELRAPLHVKAFTACVSLLVFYATPFSESLFYVFAVMMMIGLRRERHWMVVVGIFGCGLTRSVGTLFAPALLIIGLLRWRRYGRLKDWLPYLGYAVASAIPLFIVQTIQWYQTGVFYAFFNTQKRWNTEWRWPKLPFTTWGLEDNWLYDQLAIFVCLLCLVWSIAHIARAMLRKTNAAEDQPLLMSVFYCCGLGLLMLFTKGGSFNSANRYVFATPFISVIICALAKAGIRSWQSITTGVLGIAYFFYCWDSTATVSRLLGAEGLVLFAVAAPLLLQRRDRYSVIATWVLSAGLLYLQAQLWFRYITGEWVG